MKIVVAMDSFKGSLRADDACTAVRRGILAVLPDASVSLCPMADGGEGTAAAVLAASGGERIVQEVTGPLASMRVEAGFVWLSRRGPGALIEMAEASGLELLARNELDPLRTTTYGTGELVRGALERGARRLWLGIGGSATVDGGVGMARALGWRFLDAGDRDVPLGGSGLERIARVVPPPFRADAGSTIEVLRDVENPLLGPNGAAHVFGPQKGATPRQVERLELGLANLAQVIERDLGKDVRDEVGAGAAGGLGAGALAFLDARLVSGIAAVMDTVGFDEVVSGADWVVTGEGRFDEQSLKGKVVSGVVTRARARGARVAVIAGQVDLAPHRYEGSGISAAVAASPAGLEPAEALAGAAERLQAAAAQWAAELPES